MSLEIESFGIEIIILGTLRPFEVVNEDSNIQTGGYRGTNNLERLYSKYTKEATILPWRTTSQ